MINIIPVILCGGAGPRLWSLSRTGFRKQSLCLSGDESLFQQAALRLSNMGNADIRVAANADRYRQEQRFLASEQLREIELEMGRALLEPVGRSAATALTQVAVAAMKSSQASILMVGRYSHDAP